MKPVATTLFALGLALGAHDAGSTTLKSGVLANGGTPVAGATAGGKTLHGSAGQAAVGLGGGGNKVLCQGYWCLAGFQLTSVDQDPFGSNAPGALAFGRPSPNPASGNVDFAFTLPAAAEVGLGLFDVMGRRIGTLISARLDAGSFRARWDGRDATGSLVRAGAYYARFVVDGRMVARRMVVVRH